LYQLLLLAVLLQHCRLHLQRPADAQYPYLQPCQQLQHRLLERAPHEQVSCCCFWHALLGEASRQHHHHCRLLLLHLQQQQAAAQVQQTD
jgi:hypothetical protein